MDNIVFDKISIHNFLSIGDAEVELNDRGFTLVKGENCESPIRQSNGAGKSTIFDAIFWALTGTTLRGATEVINEKRAKDGCSCTLEFHTLTKNYKIVRNKGKVNNCFFYEDEVLLSDMIKKSQEFINNAIPSVSSPEILGSIILLGQGLPYKFSSFSPIKRKDLLETMSGSSSEISKVKYKLDIEENTYTEQQRNINTDISTSQGNITGLTSTLNFIDEQIKSIMTEEEINNSILEIESKQDENNKEIIKAEEALETWKSQDNTVSTSIKQMEEYLSTLNSESQMMTLKINQLVQDINALQTGTCPTCGRPYEVSNELEKHRQDLMNQRTILVQEQVDKENTVIHIKAKLQDRKKLSSDITLNIRSIESEINILKSTNYSLDKDKESLKQKLKDSTGLQQKLEETQQQIDILKVKINDLQKELISVQEYLDCISYLKRQLSKDFKGYMLKEVIEFMSSRAEYYSNYLFSNGKKVEVTLSGNNVLIAVGGRLYENLSGGERQRVDLAVQFALRDMLVTTSGFSCNLLVLDEAFDNLDAQGAESLVQLVSSEFSDISSIFVITHHTDINIPYDEQLIIRKNSDGISVIL